MSTDQRSLPGIPREQVIVRVLPQAATYRLRVDTERWEGMSTEDREAYVYEAAVELDWFKFTYEEERR